MRRVWAILLAGAAPIAPAWGQSSATPPSVPQSEIEPQTSADQPPAPETADDNVEEVIVTAQRFEQPIQETPVAVTALTAENLEQRGIANISDLAEFVPNVEINTGRTDAAGSQAAIFIRGVGQTDFLFPNDPGVGLYLDGIYLSRSVGSNLELTDIERIEVLRGPQGTLYGKNTIGGAVNVVTRRPNLSELEGQFGVILGSYDRADLNGYLSGPIIPDVLGFKISAVRQRRDGFSERSDGIGLGDRDRIGVRGALLWEPTPDLSFSLSADYSRQNENGAPGFLANVIPSENRVPAPIPDPTRSTPVDLIDLFNVVAAPRANAQLGLPAGTRFDGRFITNNRFRDLGTGRARNDNEIYGASLIVDWRLSDQVGLKSITGYRELEARFARDADHTPYDIVQTNNFQTQNQFSQELQLSLNLFDESLRVIAGAFYLTEEALDSNRVSLIAPITEATRGGVNLEWAPFQTLDVESLAFFAQANWDVTERLGLILGARWSKDEKRLFQRHTTVLFPVRDRFGNTTFCYTCEPDGVTGRTLEESWDEFTPKLGLDYELTDDILLYASYAKGFKSGGWSPRPTPTNPAELPFDPETLDSFEVGAKTQFFDRRLTVNVAGFYNEYNDVQLTTLQENFQLIVTNAAKNRIIGAEVEVFARPFRGFDLNLSAGYLDTKYEELDTPDFQLDLSDKLPNAPEFVFNGGAQYRFPLGNVGNLVLRGDASFRSKIWHDPYNLVRDSVLQIVGGQPNTVPFTSGTDGYLVTQRELATDDLWLVNARVAFTDPTERIEIAAFATNLFDEKYVDTILPITAFGFDEGVWGRPREYGLSVRYAF